MSPISTPPDTFGCRTRRPAPDRHRRRRPGRPGPGPASSPGPRSPAPSRSSATGTTPPRNCWSSPPCPQVSVRFGQPASYIDAENRRVTTADGMEFDYDELVIATGSAPAEAPVEGAARCLSYSTIDDAAGLGEAVKDVTRVLGRRPLGILVGTGSAAGQAEAVLRARGVRPIRTTAAARRRRSHPRRLRPAAAGIVFEDGSSMAGDLVVLAEEPIARDELAASAGLKTRAGGGIVIGQDFRTSVPGIWAIGDAAAFDGVRLGLLVASGSAASVCASQLLQARWAEPLAAAA